VFFEFGAENYGALWFRNSFIVLKPYGADGGVR
jgi:hypothetical protein